MIQYLTRNQLDEKNYDNCIANAVNTRIYAHSWYLDRVCDDWDVLVKNDYQYVMPLPKRRKYGIHYIYQVPWIQQLGVFSTEMIDESIVHQFIKSIPKKYKQIDIFLNSDNRFLNKDIGIRKNYILSLNSSFDIIRNAYNKNRKRISKTDFSNFKIDKKGSVVEFLNLYTNQEINYKTHKDSFEKLQNLLNYNNCNNIWNVYKNKTLVAGLYWLKDSHRITYLVPIATAEAKQENIPTFLINELIKEHENTKSILDFEGSMVEGVANFYKSFGAKEEEYFWYKKRFF